MKAVLLVAYGTPRSLDQVEAYYTHIRGGRRPSTAELENLLDRYKAIGGVSPLIDITERQRDALQNRLKSTGSATKVYSAMKHSQPFIKDVIKEIVNDGIDKLLGVALAPHYSRISTESYVQIVDAANQESGGKLDTAWVRSWHNNPWLIEAWCDKIERTRLLLTDDPHIVFSAHSLPERILAEGDPYREQLLETSRLIAERIRISRWTFAFQSSSHTGEPWLGPDILDALQRLHEIGEKNFIVAPIGFVSDHLEVLYDIDVECKEWAKKTGVNFARAASLNDSPEFIECLYSIVAQAGFS